MFFGSRAHIKAQPTPITLGLARDINNSVSLNLNGIRTHGTLYVELSLTNCSLTCSDAFNPHSQRVSIMRCWRWALQQCITRLISKLYILCKYLVENTDKPI